MNTRKNTHLKISVIPSNIPRHSEIRSNYHEAAGEWEDIYVDFSGYFGKFSPHTFAAAPELYEALKDAREELWHVHHSHMSEAEFNAQFRNIDTALAKARGAA